MYKLLVRQLNELSRLSSGLKAYLCACGEYSPDTMYDVKLTVYELAGNVLTHSKSPAEVLIELDRNSIYVNIVGGKAFKVQKTARPDPKCECGRGVFLVEQIAQSLSFCQDGRNVLAVIARKKY